MENNEEDDDFSLENMEKKKGGLGLYSTIFLITSATIIIVYLVIFFYLGIGVTRLVAGVLLIQSTIIILKVTFIYNRSFYPIMSSIFLISFGILLWPIIKYAFKIG